MTKLLARIPFQGFYNSIHELNYDETLIRMFADHATGCDEWCNIDADRVFDVARFAGFAQSYAREFCDKLGDEMGTVLEFESLTSPREYNFETDVIYAHISLDKVKEMLTAVKDSFADYVEKRCAHRSGFISHYSNDLNDWPPVEEWDHNHIFYLLTHWLETESELCEEWEFYLMDDCGGGGDFDNWVLQGNDELIALVNEHDKIEMAKRKTA